MISTRVHESEMQFGMLGKYTHTGSLWCGIGNLSIFMNPSFQHLESHLTLASHPSSAHPGTPSGHSDE